ncbi:hypothetical protein Ddye_015527 [Dipteronia dyeriana]|uniref:tyrosine--tRNA ligase n=1 Tax=Dipteronia dyeriana TaxID=168575 RepID=A0AAD9U5R0_9ROSI|nr:hypothetical protein Ddye_015527 [Dipteronia dyeriana]
MGGDLKKIQTVGRYVIEIWKAAGMDLNGVEFIWSSEVINSQASDNEEDESSALTIMYPCMQCADIFFLKADTCLLGMDQRRVNELARECCDDIKRKNKPIILWHRMSKSDPSSSIFMDDGEAKVNEKIKKAYCPPKLVQGNPCLEYIKFIIFPVFNEFKVERSAANGGDKTYTSHEELIADYAAEKLHSADLKPALSKALNKILQPAVICFYFFNLYIDFPYANLFLVHWSTPVRDHFNEDANGKDLQKRVKSYGYHMIWKWLGCLGC